MPTQAPIQAIVHRDGRLVLAGQVFRVALGRGGVRGVDKQERDDADARRHSAAAPRCCTARIAGRRRHAQCRSSALAPDDGWCDGPGHDDYNRIVRLPA